MQKPLNETKRIGNGLLNNMILFKGILSFPSIQNLVPKISLSGS
jgi:hypothetical protein